MDPTEPKAEAIHVETSSYRKRLNLHVPILSIKRPGGRDRGDRDREPPRTAAGEVGSCRIPFSWEQSPGKPKGRIDGQDEEAETPRPGLPPSRWRPNANRQDRDLAHDYETGTPRVGHVPSSGWGPNLYHERDQDRDRDLAHDYGCDGDDENGVSSDGMDMMSLSEAIDFIERSEKVQEPERPGSETEGSGEVYYMHSPNFIMERFLPDASALAAASSLAASRDVITDFPYNDTCGLSAEIRGRKRRCLSTSTTSCSSRKGCGLEMLLFPWRMKHKICGVKSPADVAVARHVNSRYCSVNDKDREKKHRSMPFTTSLDVNRGS